MTETPSDQHSFGLRTRNVFLDTELYRSHAHNLRTKMMKLLGNYVADGIFLLHVTDVTLREVRRQISTMEREMTNRANKVSKELAIWNTRYRSDHHHLPVPDRLSETSDPSRAYLDFERTLCHDWNAKKHRAADLSIGSVLDQYFERRAPFDREGSKEFPDAIALLVLEKWCLQTQECIYIVSKDKAVQRAAAGSDWFISVNSLDCLFSLVAEAGNSDMAKMISIAFNEPPLVKDLEDALSCKIGDVGGVYDGERDDGEVLGMELVELVEIEDVTVVRVDQALDACVADVRMLITAEINYTDVSDAIWDSEDGRYYGGESVETEIQDTVGAKIFVELKRNGDDITLVSVQFLTPEVTVSDDFDPEYPF